MFSPKKTFTILLGITIFSATLAGVIVWKNPHYVTRAKRIVRQLIAEPQPPRREFASRLKRNAYSQHRESARSSGMPKVTDGNFSGLIESGKLIKVRGDKGYKLHSLTHSRPYLTPRGASVLKSLGEDFSQRTKSDDFFVVTSLTRSLEAQRRLSRTNRNATKNISTHSYGVSFDVSYTRFNGRRGKNSRLQKIFEDLLIEYQSRGRIHVLMEKQSTCYHITVR